MPCAQSLRRLTLRALLWLGVVAGAAPTAATPTTHAERMHAKALELLLQGRVSQAYGRFVDLANAGHGPSARYALWMCTQGLEVFGKDWDCAAHEVEDWARLAGIAAPRMAARQYGTRQQATQPAPR
jgi:hypothetical protein